MSVIIDGAISYERVQRQARRRDPHTRFDVQGLRMVAVLTVFANHLWGWPHGGFIGVDVFFVISGFLITGGLLRTFDRTGSISFTDFYWRRFKRIVPAAVIVLALTCAATAWAFVPNRAHSTYWDALAGLTFWSNWRFAVGGTDYFTADGPISPLRHFWSLSIEEQFYFVWPLVVLLIGVLALRRGGSSSSSRLGAAVVMGIIVVASFAWSVYETSTAATWAYFNTFARIWELGAGALIAICAGAIAPRLPDWSRTALSCVGLGAIVVAVFVVPEAPGFPAPWAALPVLGAALVIVAGIGREPLGIAVLTNPVSRYIGDISYSLYLWHWPVIVILSSQVPQSNHLYIAVIGISLSGAIASYHLVENPIRKGSLSRVRRTIAHRSLARPPRKSTGYGALAAAMLLLVGLYAYGTRPAIGGAAPPFDATAAVALAGDEGGVFAAGSATTALQTQLASAVSATSWPALSPSIDAVTSGPQVPADISPCGQVERPSRAQCTWGDPRAPQTITVLGDSVAMTYIEPLRKFAEASGGQWKVTTEAMFGCTFTSLGIRGSIPKFAAACPDRKASAIRAINQTKPTVVMIANSYGYTNASGWSKGMKTATDEFAASTRRIVFLSPPPSDKNIQNCYTQRSTPASCLSRVTSTWQDIASAERGVAGLVNGAWVDSTPWFCTPTNYCPAFAGTTPTKLDTVHMTPEFADVIAPAFIEALTKPGVLTGTQ